MKNRLRKKLKPICRLAAADEGQGVDGAQSTGSCKASGQTAAGSPKGETSESERVNVSVHEVLEASSTGATQPFAAAVEYGDRFLGSRYAWAVVGMLWMVCFLNYADRQVISAIFPVLEKQFGFSKFQLGLIGSIFMWVYVSVVFFAGFLGDRVKRTPLILGGCLFWSIVTACTGFCSLLWQFLAVRGLEGLGEAFYFPASNSLIADYHEKKNRSTALAWHQSGVYLGTIAGSSLGAWLAQYYGWRYGFYFFGGLGVVVSLVLFFFLKEPRRAALEKEQPLGVAVSDIACEPHKMGMLATVRYLLQRPALILLALTFASANFVTGIFLTWMPTFLYEKFHMTLAMAGCSAVIFIQLACAVTAPCAGWIADRLSQKKKHGRVLLQMVSLLIGAVVIVVIGKATTVMPLFAAMILFGICKGAYDTGIFGALFDYIEPAMRGSASGLVITCGWFGGGLGPMLLGAIATYGGASATAMNRMSATISASAGAYLLGASFLMGVIFVTKEN